MARYNQLKTYIGRTGRYPGRDDKCLSTWLSRQFKRMRHDSPTRLSDELVELMDALPKCPRRRLKKVPREEIRRTHLPLHPLSYLEMMNLTEHLKATLDSAAMPVVLPDERWLKSFDTLREYVELNNKYPINSDQRDQRSVYRFYLSLRNHYDELSPEQRLLVDTLPGWHNEVGC